MTYLVYRDCPLGYEPSGYDFLSPCLQEVDLMVKVVQDDSIFYNWVVNFLCIVARTTAKRAKVGTIDWEWVGRI